MNKELLNPFDIQYLPKLPQDKSVPIGCIGSGFVMADCQLVAYRNAGFNPVAIASRNHEKAQQVATRHSIKHVYQNYRDMLDADLFEVLDIAVPPDAQLHVIQEAVERGKRLRGILAQKPLGINYGQALQIVQLCENAGIKLVINQNMRFDQSVKGLKSLIDQNAFGDPVLATIDMRAIPHWMPWQERQGWVTLRIMSIHHLDTFRYWFGDPVRIYASVRKDPRTSKQFEHHDGICMYILEYENGLRAMSVDDVWAGPAKEGSASDTYIRWRVEGTEGMAKGTIGWPEYPKRTPSTLDYTTIRSGPQWVQPRWEEVWFPDAFVGPMAQLMCALEEKFEPELNGRDNLKTMALVDAAYLSAEERRSVEIDEILSKKHR